MPLFHHDDDDLDGCDVLLHRRDDDVDTPDWLVPILVLLATRFTRDEIRELRERGRELFG